jgi:hypothetical protein
MRTTPSPSSTASIASPLSFAKDEEARIMIQHITNVQSAVIAEAEAANDESHDAHDARDRAMASKLERDRAQVDAQYGAASERGRADRARADAGWGSSVVGLFGALSSFVPFFGQVLGSVLGAVGAMVFASGQKSAADHDGPAANLDQAASEAKVESERIEKMVQDREADRDDAKDKLRRAISLAEQYAERKAKAEQIG